MVRDELLELLIEDEAFEAASEYSRRNISSSRVQSIGEILSGYLSFSRGQYVPVIPRSTYVDVLEPRKVLAGNSSIRLVTDYSAIHRVNCEQLYLKSKPPGLLLLDNVKLDINRVVVANSFSTIVGELSDLSGGVAFIFTHRDVCELSSSLSPYFGANNFKGDLHSAKYDVIVQALPLSYLTESEKILKDVPLLRVYNLELVDDSGSRSKILNKPLVDSF